MTQINTLEKPGFKQDVRHLGEGVQTLKADVSNLAHGAADAARSGAAELRDGAHHAIEVAKENLVAAKDKAAEATETVKSAITRHPLTSIGIAAGVGVIIGMIVFRRSN